MITMEETLKETLVGFTNIRVDVRKGITHTSIRVTGDATKVRNPGFQADVYVQRRTQSASIARIDTGDTQTLYRIVGVLSRFKF